MRHFPPSRRKIIPLTIFLSASMTTLAQTADPTSSPAGLSMLVLFMGIAAIVGVFVIRWTQSTPDDED